MSIKPRTILTGLASFVPGVMPLYRRFGFRPFPAPPATCHGIWLKHAVMARRAGFDAEAPVLAELGPGLSLGVGLAALICGASRYLALDVLPFARLDRVLADFDALAALLRERRRPDNADGFPPYAAALDAGGFPLAWPDGEHWAALMDARRLQLLRAEVEDFVRSGGRANARLAYFAPWDAAAVREAGGAELLLSHTVLQHVDDVAGIWGDMAALLRPGGFCTHQINFDSHGTAALWNGHWSGSELAWRLALGRKEFLINREPLSAHLAAACAAGLTVQDLQRNRDAGGIARAELAPRWRALDEEDLHTRGAFVVARKPA